jgi:hypothetical protein
LITPSAQALRRISIEVRFGRLHHRTYRIEKDLPE